MCEKSIRYSAAGLINATGMHEWFRHALWSFGEMIDTGVTERYDKQIQVIAKIV